MILRQSEGLLRRLRVLALFIVWACGSAHATPLFDAEEVLDIALTGPLGTIARDRREPKRKQYLFEMKVGDTTLPVMARVRGRSRTVHCTFPPLWLRFGEGVANGTPFAHQTALPLVTHCRNDEDHFENNVLDEYLAYRIFHLISEAGYRVRLLRISYLDSDQRLRGLDRPYYAFALEPDDELAARLGGTIAELEGVRYGRLDPSQTAKLSVFQYLIANTDWSFVRNPDDDGCCHNIDLVDTGNALLPIPRDFDLSGLVDAAYARPAEGTRIRRVTTRVYRGYCRSSIDDIARALDAIVAQREAIMAVAIATPALGDKDRASRAEYIDRFFEAAVDDREKLIRRFEKDCIGRG